MVLTAGKIAGRSGERLAAWPGIEPGDVGWDEGGGVVGFGIRAATLGAYAHCYVYTGWPDDGGCWETVEAYPGGVKLRRDRTSRRVHRVMRLWRDNDERQAIIDCAHEFVGKRYAYGELLAICLNRLGVRVGWPDNPATAICSNVCAAAVLAARRDVELTRRPDRIWPARLERDLARAAWSDQRQVV